MEIIFELLGEILTTALITKNGIYTIIALILIGGIIGITYYMN